MEQNENKEQWEIEAEARNSALMLLDEYVKNHSREFAEAFTNIIPFINYECRHSGLEDCVSTVNTAIAVMALEVIQDFYEKEEGDPDRRILPCGSDDLIEAVKYLTRFISKTSALCRLLSQQNVPAFDLCSKFFYEGLRRKL